MMITELKQNGKNKEDMKMKKIFSNITMLAALFVAGAAFTACSNESDDITTIEQPTVNGQKVYTMTIQAGKSSDAITRALELSDGKLVAKWANGDEVTVLKGTTSLGTLTASDVTSDGKSCTLSGTLTGEIAVGNSLTLAYHPIGTTLSAIQTAFNTQTGTLANAAALDCATATVTVKTVSGGAITINESSAAFSGQTSVLKLTMKDASSNAINATSLTVAVGTTDVFTFSSLSPTDSVVYLALPTQAQVAAAVPALASVLGTAPITFTASDGSNTYTASKTGYTFAAAKYYGTTLTMARTVDLYSLSAAFTAQDGDVLTGTLVNEVQISIADGATVTLSGVSINAEGDFYSGNYAGLTCAGDATIILADGSENNVKGFHKNYPGIFVPEGKTLTINGQTSGTGQLTAISGTTDYDSNGCGIGGGYQISCGNISIAGGTVNATGGNQAAGIGSGREASCGNISITGGTITATGGSLAAGIGSGGNGASCGTINIAATVTSVTATKGYGGFNESIGKGQYSSCGTVTIEDGANVTWN